MKKAGEKEKKKQSYFSASKSSSEKSSVNSEYVFSHKRYFLNNLDTYHGQHFLKELSQLYDIPESTKNTSQTYFGEDAPILEPPPPPIPYEIIGTVTGTPPAKSIDNVTRIVSKTECITHMLTCGTVILDITCDRDELRIAMDYIKVLKELLERQQAPSKANDDADKTSADGIAGDPKRRFLILVSTVMTWASTKPLDPETPEMPFIETDFRKRKPHPNYKLHYDVENEVVLLARKYRPLIGALVVAAGMTYGGREDVLFYWFQKAWESEPILPILGRGNNAVPLINIRDLAKIIYNLATNFPRKLYILAVEQNVTRQKQIVKPLGRQIGSGMFKCIPSADAFLIPEIDQRIYDLMTVNLNMEPSFIVETMGHQWISEASFGENVPALMKQFKKERNLKPFKIVIYGPPIVGKTTLAKSICEAYGLIYISPETVVQDMIDDLTWRIRHWEIGETAALGLSYGEEEVDPNDADNEEEGDEGSLEAAKQNLAMLQSGRQFSDDEILGYLRQRLLCREAQNRGWVLDGYPMSLLQCAQLFEKGDDQDSEVGEEAEEEPFDEDVDLYSNVLRKILPDIVVSLDANDDFICEKAMRQPEGDARLDEETILRRLSEFRAGDTREITPLNFFDELDIHPLVVSVKDHADYGMKGPYASVTLRMGRPCRYAKLLALIEAAEKKQKDEQETLKAQEAKALRELEQKLKEEREEKMEYWTELYAMLREEEEAALAAAGEPMRNYLVHHIFPTLTPALLEVAKLRPDDPIDFLAETTFKLNPIGKLHEDKYRAYKEKLRGKRAKAEEKPTQAALNINPDDGLPRPSTSVEHPKPFRHNIQPMSAL